MEVFRLLRSLLLAVLATWLLMLPAPAGAEEVAAQPAAETPTERLTEARRALSLEGRELRYTVRAGYLPLSEGVEHPKASIFYVAYTLDGTTNPGARPITFAFNGGPGSSSAWLHMGLLGPQRVDMGEEGLAAAPPFRLIDNPATLLDVSDLVLIDPVSTGFSRAANGADSKQFHGVRSDVESVGEFIRLYVGRNDRWASPKLLIGESYGSTRAAGLSGYLQDRHGMYLNGLMLVSSILSFQTARFDPGNDLPYALFLPTYAATARYHGKLAPEHREAELETFLDEVESFALGDYTLALMQGSRLPAAEHRRTAERLAAYTGLELDFIERHDLRVDIYTFVRELLRAEDRVVGRLDSRFVGIDPRTGGDFFTSDPSYTAILGPYSAALKDYLRREIGFESDLPYEILTDEVNPWSFDELENRYLNVAETLREAISKNPSLKVFVANGYYDLATPYFATEHTFAHMGLDATLEANVSMAYYEAGHMMYIHRPSLMKLKRDLAAFVRSATLPEGGARETQR